MPVKLSENRTSQILSYQIFLAQYNRVLAIQIFRVTGGNFVYGPVRMTLGETSQTKYLLRYPTFRRVCKIAKRDY